MQPRTRRRTLAVTAFSLLLACVGDTVRAQSWLGDASVGVQVRGAGGALTGARVEVLYRGPGGESGGPAPRATNEQGQASFTGLAEGVWSLEVSHPDHLSFIATLSLRSARKTEVVSSFLEASGAGRNPLRVRLFQPGTRLLGTPLTVSEAPPAAPPPLPEQPAESPVDELEEPASPPAAAPAPAELPEPGQAPSEPDAQEPPAAVETGSPGAGEMASPADDAPPTPPPAPEPEAPAEPAAVEPSSEGTAAAEPADPMEAPTDEPPAAPTAPASPTPIVPAPTEPDAPVVPEAKEEDAAPPRAEPAAADSSATVEPPADERSAEPEAPPAPAATPPVPTEPPPGDEPPADAASSRPVHETTPELSAATPPPAPAPTPPTPAEAPPGDEPPMPVETPPEAPPSVPAPPATTAPTTPAPAETPALVEPAVDEPAPQAPATAPPVTERPAAAPPAAAPEPLRGADASARSFRDRTCFECKPGEWAVGASSEVPAGDGCPDGALDRAAAGIELLAAGIGPALAGYGGNALSAEALGRLGGAARTEVADRIDPLLDPRSPCRLVALALPAGARMSGFRFEAFEDGEGGDCVGDQPCPVGDSRWLASPGVERGDGATLLWAVFENRSSSRARLARFIGYFTPPAGWRP